MFLFCKKQYFINTTKYEKKKKEVKIQSQVREKSEYQILIYK